MGGALLFFCNQVKKIAGTVGDQTYCLGSQSGAFDP